MSLNCNEINLILNELSLEGSFIQDIIQPSFDTLAFFTYKMGEAKTILICTAQNAVRINATERKITKNEKPLRFMEFLRSKIKGCRINTCKQIGLERVIKLTLSRRKNLDGKIQSPQKKEPFCEYKEDLQVESEMDFFNLYIRLWNNAANVILCDKNDLVLDSMFRRPEKYEVKGEVFIAPSKNISKGKKETDFPVREWKGEKNKTGEIFKDFNQFIDWKYAENESTLSRTALLTKAEKWYETNLIKRELALKNLEEKLKAFENSSKLRHYGDLLLSLPPQTLEGKRSLECQDYENGRIVSIIIDPKKSLQENAAEYYKKYKKAESGKSELERDIEISKAQIEKLKEKYEKIKKEQNPIKLEQMLRQNTRPLQQKKKEHPGLDFLDDGWLILVGRNAGENDELLRHHVRGEDLWLHVRDFSGGYVFIKAQKGKTVPLDILLDAGNLAVYYSKARNAGTTDLYYTHVKYLRRAKNGPKGLVIPTQEKNLCIKTDKNRLARLNTIKKESEF